MKTGTTFGVSHAIARLVGSESGMIQKHMGHCIHVERASETYKQTNSQHRPVVLKERACIHGAPPGGRYLVLLLCFVYYYLFRYVFHLYRILFYHCLFFFSTVDFRKPVYNREIKLWFLKYIWVNIFCL